jgi:hypothetical protein
MIETPSLCRNENTLTAEYNSSHRNLQPEWKPVSAAQPTQ